VSELKNGDIVELKSGGPKMTIDFIGHVGDPQKADCSWFKGDAHHSGTFPVTSLKPYVARKRASTKIAFS